MPGNLYFFNKSSIICLSVHGMDSVIGNTSVDVIGIEVVVLDVLESIKKDLLLW